MKGLNAAVAGDTVPQRRAVCAAVLDFLLTGQATGKPELDGFAQVARAAGLVRADLDRFCDGLAVEATLPRYATWKRLRQMCDQTGGAAVGLAFTVLRGREPARQERTLTGDAPAAPLEHDQILAWGAALRMARLLESIGPDLRAGKLLLPLDDLIKFNLRESEVSAMAAAGGLPAQADLAARWRELMKFEIERVRRLYDGGVGCLSGLDGGPRRAAAILGELQMARLNRLERAGYDAFAQPAAMSLRQRLAVLPAAMRRAMAQPGLFTTKTRRHEEDVKR